MAWTLSHDVGEFAAAVVPLLEDDPERHTITLTVIEGARYRGEPMNPPQTFAWWTENGAVSGCASITPPYPLLVEAMPERAIRPLLRALRADSSAHVVGVNGTTDLAASVAAAWRTESGDRVVLGDVTRLFRLGALSRPQAMPTGHCRAADEADCELLLHWYTEFGRVVHGPMPRVGEAVSQRLEYGGLSLWCDEDGVPVSMAGRGLPAAGVARIGPVYTPQEFRGRGYGGAVTYAVSDAVLRDGLRAVLFTDQANPTSNALYMRLGYQPVTDRLSVEFERR
jgi:predicted GNAT family acetyltransferase